MIIAMDARHALDLKVDESDITFRNINLVGGDSYGCRIIICVEGTKRIDLLLILYPDLSTVSRVKTIFAKIGDVYIDVIETRRTIFTVNYLISTNVEKYAYVDIFTDITHLYKYPILMVDLKREIYSVIDKADSETYLD